MYVTIIFGSLSIAFIRISGACKLIFSCTERRSKAQANNCFMHSVMVPGWDPAYLYRLLGLKKRPSGPTHHVQRMGWCMAFTSEWAQLQAGTKQKNCSRMLKTVLYWQIQTNCLSTVLGEQSVLLPRSRTVPCFTCFKTDFLFELHPGTTSPSVM